MIYGIFSDIHANLEAFDAVLKRLHEFSVDRLLCLGDIIGYGPNPVECLRIAARLPVVVAGDWERSVLDRNLKESCAAIDDHLAWVQKQLQDAYDGVSLTDAARGFSEVHNEINCTFAHSIPSDMRDFLFPDDIYNSGRLDRIATEFESLLFTGHTHIPGLFVRTRGDWSYIETYDDYRFDISDYEKVICNVGSVGQPRDGMSQASFVLFDGRTVVFQRLEYDVNVTVSKIDLIPEIDNIHGKRLREGR